MDINTLNDRITQLEEQNKNLVNYINTFMEYHTTRGSFDHIVPYVIGLNEKLNALPPIEMPPLPPTTPPRRTPPPLPIAAEVIPILTIPSAPPLPLRKKVSC